MTTPRILATANSFSGIERAVEKAFKKPMRLLYDGDEWRVCLPDLTPFGEIHTYHVVRQGTRYRLEARQNARPANIIHRPDSQRHTEPEVAS